MGVLASGHGRDPSSLPGHHDELTWFGFGLGFGFGFGLGLGLGLGFGFGFGFGLGLGLEWRCATKRMHGSESNPSWLVLGLGLRLG